MEKVCCVKGCGGKYGGWIDIVDDKVKHKKGTRRPFARFPFCKKHFDIIYPYIQLKEKEMQEKEGKNFFWVLAPLSLVEEALNQ